MDAGVKPRPRINIRNRYVLLGDLALIIVSVMGSFALRLDAEQLPFYFPAIAIMLGVALLTKVPTYYAFGLYRRLWVYASTSELRLITVAVSTASVVTSGVMLLLISFGWVVPGMPRSALGIDWLLSLVLIGGSRFALRILSEQSSSVRNGKKSRVLVIGAGDAGALVVRELQKSSQINLLPVGFLDDNLAKQKYEINGVPVIGKVSDLSKVLENQLVDEVIIAIPSAPGKILRTVTDVCRLKGIPSRTMPGIVELIGGKVSVSRLREVDITDLLRREPAKIDDRLNIIIDHPFENKNISCMEISNNNDIFLGGDIHDIFGTIAKQEAKDRNLQLQEEQEAAAQAKKQIAQQLANQVKAANVGQAMRKGGKVKSKSYKHGGKLGCGVAIKGYGKGPYKKKGM